MKNLTVGALRATLGLAWTLIGVTANASGIEPILPNSSVRAVGIVTADVEKTAQRYGAVFGSDSWEVADEAVEIIDYRTGNGIRSRATLRTAVGKVKDRQFELIQPMRGSSPFQDFLTQRKETAAYYFSLGTIANALDAIKKLQASGYKLLMQVHSSNGQLHTYMDTSDELGGVLEFSSEATRSPKQKSISRTLKISELPDPKRRLDMTDKRLGQLAFVVTDGEKVAKSYADIFGVKLNYIPPLDLDMSAVRNMDLPLNSTVGIKVYLGQWDTTQIEVIEQLVGDTTYRRFMRRNGGSGIHHMSFGFVPDAPDTEDRFRKAGYVIDMGGTLRRGTIRFFYMDTPDLGFDVEFLQ